MGAVTGTCCNGSGKLDYYDAEGLAQTLLVAVAKSSTTGADASVESFPVHTADAAPAVPLEVHSPEDAAPTATDRGKENDNSDANVIGDSGQLKDGGSKPSEAQEPLSEGSTLASSNEEVVQEKVTESAGQEAKTAVQGKSLEDAVQAALSPRDHADPPVSEKHLARSASWSPRGQEPPADGGDQAPVQPSAKPKASRAKAKAKSKGKENQEDKDDAKVETAGKDELEKAKGKDESKSGRAYPMYFEGYFIHETFGNKKVGLVVTLESDTTGSWKTMKKSFKLKCKWDGDNVWMTDSLTALSGVQDAKGNIKGSVTQEDKPGGNFKLKLQEKKPENAPVTK